MYAECKMSRRIFFREQEGYCNPGNFRKRLIFVLFVNSWNLLKLIVYLYECRHCESRYVGRTLQRLEDRVKQHVPRHLLNPTDGTEKKRGPGRPPKERKSADEYQSAIACHLAADALCRARYSDLDFRILARARSEQHLKVLEALYIQSLKPVLCRQKQFVTDLKLFHRPRT